MVLQNGFGFGLIFTKGMQDQARASLSKVLELAQSLQDLEYQQRALFGLWLFAMRTVEFTTGLDFARQYQRLPGAAADPAAQPTADWMIGLSQCYLGEHDGSGERLQQALSRYPVPSRLPDLARFGAPPRVIAHPPHAP